MVVNRSAPRATIVPILVYEDAARGAVPAKPGA